MPQIVAFHLSLAVKKNSTAVAVEAPLDPRNAPTRKRTDELYLTEILLRIKKLEILIQLKLM
jgi:hypothetical protein